MNKRALSERDICTKFITPAAQLAGWKQHQFREEVKLTKGRVIVRGQIATRIENPEAIGGPRRADYVFYGLPNLPLAVLEAKSNIFEIGSGMQQALAYAEMLDAPIWTSRTLTRQKRKAMRFTHEDESLFLLDEPDTHLNPIWKLRYFDEIGNVVRLQDESSMGDSQLIITTHDPLMIGSLRKEQVRILKCDEGQTKVITPTEHPQGMGIAGLLKSQLFGLPSTLDSVTLEKLQRRNELLARESKKKLTPVQEKELAKLRAYLDDLGFSREFRDPLYQLFIQKMYDVRSRPLGEVLSPSQLKRQEALAEKIVREIVKSEKTKELSTLAEELKVAVTP